MRFQATVLRHLERFRSRRYLLKPIPEYIEYLTERFPIQDEETLRAKALLYESDGLFATTSK